MTRLPAIAILTLALPAFAADYRVLIPTYVDHPLPGAYGSLWTTPLAIHNGTTTTFSFGQACREVCIERPLLKPGATQVQLNEYEWEWKGGIPTRLLTIYAVDGTDSPASLSFQLRAADISRAATNAGTETPVVRETEFRRSTVHLLNIPTDPRFRLTLRIYEMDVPVADFAIRVYDQSSNALLGTTMLQLAMPLVINLPSIVLVPAPPAYAEIGELTGLIYTGTSALPQTLRLEIEPKTTGSAFWAFVSITNNDTQHVTLVTPQ